jgi:hypothetical protein
VLIKGKSKVKGIAWGFTYRLLVLLGGVTLIFVLPMTTSINEQGIYYALLGLVSLFAIADLGLSSALVNFIAHQKNSITDKIEKKKAKRANLASLLIFSTKWSLVGSCMLGCLIFLIGQNTLSPFFDMAPDLFFAIILISVVSAFFFQLIILFAIMEGLNLVNKMFFYRSCYMFIFIISQVTLLFLDFSYKSIVYAQLISTITVYVLVIFKHIKMFLSFALHSTEEADISILHDVIPFQFKVAISWVFGFIPIQIMPTFIASSLGLVWAAKIGMTQQIITAISATAFVCIQIVIPQMGQLASKMKNRKVKIIYHRALKLSLLVSIIGVLGFGGFYFLAIYFYDIILDRILPLNLLILYSSMIIVNWITFARASLGRAFHIEIMLWPTIMSGVFIIFLLAISKQLSPSEFVFYYVGTYWITCVFIGGFLFKRFTLERGLK